MNNSKEKGAASIEATLSLTIFIFVITGIYMVINYALVQAKVGYAINTTAKEMSQYCYFYHMLGLEDLDGKLKEDKMQAVGAFETFNKAINSSADVVDKLTDDNIDKSEYVKAQLESILSGKDGNVYSDIKAGADQLVEIVKDPVSFFKSMGALAGSELLVNGRNILAAGMAKGMTRRHFGDSQDEANKNLKAMGVVNGYDGMNFYKSTMFADDADGKTTDDIRIVVYYQIDLASMLPFDLKITVCQQSVTRAWLGGDKK